MNLNSNNLVFPWQTFRQVRKIIPCLTGLAVFFAQTEPVFAAGFPRGPGFYFNPYKLAFFLMVFLAWVQTASWADRDCKKLKIETIRWNPLFLGVGLLGFLLIWVLPWFWVSWLLFLCFLGGISYWYVATRNELVDYEDRLLTEYHLRALVRRFTKWELPSSDGDGDGGSQGAAPVRFLTRSTLGREAEENEDHIARVQESKGYRAAQQMIYQAIELRATDIHMEPTKEVMTVRFRIDGIMTTQEPFTRSMGDAVLNILKVIANLDITEKRKPQDGGLSAMVEDRQVDLRVATAGSVVGEKMVLRILSSSQKMMGLPQVGLREKLREQVRGIIKQPHGLFLVCGPTGSGKTSTLYACLNEMDRYQQNIITIENPVEYQMENVTQIEVNVKAGKTFASELRSILRQDPDVILIGEIRDQETAEIACQAAQTGHLVLSTLHSNDAVLAIGRLIDLGVQPFMIGTALSGVLAQRLVRLLCNDCKVRYRPNPEMLKKANLPADKIEFFYRPPNPEERGKKKCPTCGGTGYYKRAAIFELLVVTERIREMIKENPNLAAVKQEAVKNGMRYLQDDGLRKVIEGKTSIQELMRVSK